MKKIIETDDGVKLNIQITGEGKPILFIHGWAATSNFWKYQIDFFSRRYQIITYDQRGHGNSDKKESVKYTISRFVKDLELVIDELNLEGFIIVGHSMGTLIATKYISENQEKVEGVALTGVLLKTYSGISGAINLFLMKILSKSRRLAERIITPRMFGSRATPELIRFVQQESAKSPTKLLFRIFGEIRGESIEEDLPKLDIPCLVVLGKEDKAISPAQQLKAIKLLKNPKVVELEKCGHNAMLECPDEFNKALDSFLHEINF